MCRLRLQSAFLLLCCGTFPLCDSRCEWITRSGYSGGYYGVNYGSWGGWSGWSSSYDNWNSWGACSASCGGGTRMRYRSPCGNGNNQHETSNCHELCYNGGTYHGSRCHCKPWRYGSCCQSCSSTYNIPHCSSSECGGNPDNIRCTNCQTPYYIGGFGKGCIECTNIPHCKDRHCSSQNDAVCDKCYDDNIFYKRTHSNTSCERLCSFDTHKCWPGSCSNGLTSTCTCASDFILVKSSTETSCQLSKTPTIVECKTAVTGPKGEKKRTDVGKCQELKDFWGNFQPTSLKFSMTSDLLIDVTKLSIPRFISESNFGVTDTRIVIQKVKVSGTIETIAALNQSTDTNNGMNATQTVFNADNVTLDQPKHNLSDGDRLCFQYEAFGGGYVKAYNFDNSSITSPFSYKKTKSIERVCFMFDNTRPQHCLALHTCSVHIDTQGPLRIKNRITRSPIISLEFSGWIDPIPVGGKREHSSGIESYEISVNEVSNGTVDIHRIFSKKLNSSETSLTLNLTSDSPKLYCITLEVKDVADNVQQARRFVLYDNTTFITSRIDKDFLVISASQQTNYTWQTHHKDICLSWTDHFYNKFYMDNNLLGQINPDPNRNMTNIYEQVTGLLPVSGTPNVFGITSYNFSWSFNGKPFSAETIVPDFLNQTYCYKSMFSDGQSYTLSIKAIDILNNTFTENRTVHIDRSVPHINNIGLMNKGEKRIFVHDDTDLSKMNLIFDALDPHSGLHSVSWRFGTSDSGDELGSGLLAVSKIDQDRCPRHFKNCYCPDVGKCERYNYSISLNKLVQQNTHKGTHNRNYYFTITVTNNAMLSNVEHLDILVDDSPPEVGVIYEGAIGTSDIDFTSENSFIVRWHGFIDHESGIKEYRLGLSEQCLHKEQLFYQENSLNETKYMTVFPTESVARLAANFTGKRYVSIVAINNAYAASDVVCSDGITRDETPPVLTNVKLENGKWSESIYCHNQNAWLLLSNMKKIKLPDINECKKRCILDSMASDVFETLEEGKTNSHDNSLGAFVCKHLPLFSAENIIYLPSDRIYLSWEVTENDCQIEDFYVGFGSTYDNSSDLSIMGYKSTMKRQHFETRHLGISTGESFYLYLKTLNKAKLETLTVIGPVLIDETPPHFQSKPRVEIKGDIVTIGWNNDTVYDPEQAAPINQILFQIVQDGRTVTPLLEWRLIDSKPCRNFSGGCMAYPLHFLQKLDADLGLEYSVKGYAYNNAGHFAVVETGKFFIPSRYPPGHALVHDIDPGDKTTLFYKDADVHFTAKTLCAHWIGFKHHEDVTIEIGVGKSRTVADILPFQQTNASNTTCMKSEMIHFNTEYFLHLRASCSGGRTTSTSDGVIIVNETHFWKSFNIFVGSTLGQKDIIWSTRFFSDKNETVLSPVKNLQIGQIYNLTLMNITSNVSVCTNDTMLIRTKLFNMTSKTMYINVIPFTDRPCIIIDNTQAVNITGFALKTAARDEYSNSKHVLSNTSNLIDLNWKYDGPELIFNRLLFDIALAEVRNQFNKSTFNYVNGLVTVQERTRRFIKTSQLRPDRAYTVIIKSCTTSRCIGPAFSRQFEIESSITAGELRTSNIELDNKKTCVGVSLSWEKSKAKSNVTIYQWSISRDADAKLLLKMWSTVLDVGNKIYKVNKCVFLPVFGHATLYVCVKSYSAAGNVATACKRASVVGDGDINKDTLYDIDASVDSWNDIKQMIHSSNIGNKQSILHDGEMDFGTNRTTVVGALMYATERNVTWYLMRKQRLPFFFDCDKDSDCLYSMTTDTGYVSYDRRLFKEDVLYYTCAYSNATSVLRELFNEVLNEVGSCSNGFILDNTPPVGGQVKVQNTDGFVTSRTEIDITWNGFDDNVDAVELGYVDRIKYYSYAAGTRPGADDISKYTIVGNLQQVLDRHQDLPDGTAVFVSVKATDHAGLSREVYSEELTVDASPPSRGNIIINGNSSYISSSACEIFLKGFRDEHSGIDHFEVSVGSNVESSNTRSSKTYLSDRITLALSDEIHDGHKYFISAKAVNRAGLSSELASASITLDRSPPTGGHVLDGHWQTQKDIDFQTDLDYIQGHWKGFTDQHSGVVSYMTGLGTHPYTFDVEPMVDVGLRTDIKWRSIYEIGTTYYITVQACNGAGLCRSVSSDGIVLDNSPPIHGLVKVGTGHQHQPYLPSGAAIHISWVGFEDPQSRIDHYAYCIGTETNLCNVVNYTNCLLESSILKTGLNLLHGMQYYASVKAFNRAGSSVETTSASFTIDNSPPALVRKPTFLFDFNAIPNEMAQWDKSVLRVYWKFRDNESMIATHKITLKTHHEGHTPLENIHVGNVDKLTINLDDKSWLNNGDRYFFVVTSCNTAGLCTSSESDELLIDSTPPHLGGFKPPMIWNNFIDPFNSTKSRITVSWYGFVDPESAIDLFYLTVSRNYSGHELSGGIITKVADRDKIEQNATIVLQDAIVPDEVIILTVWAKNLAGLNSSVSRISVNALSLNRINGRNAAGILEIQKHSCDVHFCNKDCTCAVVGRPCIEVSTNLTCTLLNTTDVMSLNLPVIKVYGGLVDRSQNITLSSACLSGHWVAQGDETSIQRYEWSMGIKDQKVGEGIFDLKSEIPWKDVGKRRQAIYCLQHPYGLKHDMKYNIYVRAWYSKTMYAEFKSYPIHVDHTPPHPAKGKHIIDSGVTCSEDYDFIDWMNKITACWKNVFTESQGEIIYYQISLGTTVNGSDIYQSTNVGLRTNITFENITLSHGTRYFITVTAYNNVGLHTTLTSDGFVVDMDKPIPGVVFNTGKHTDTTFQSSFSSFTVSWHGFIDHFSGIKSYHVALVESSELQSDNISFINVGLQTKHKFSHLLLTNGKSYIGLVKAEDNAGHISDVAWSSPKHIDVTAPEPFHCKDFKSLNVTSAATGVPGVVIFYQNITVNNYYIIKGFIEAVSTDITPLLSVDRSQIPLTLSFNDNATAEFDYSFLSSNSGETRFSISALGPSYTQTNVSVRVEMLMCTSDMTTTDISKAIQLRQIGSSRLAVDLKIMDRESALYKVKIGAGTTPGGFQLRPLTDLFGGTSGVIDIDSEHGSHIYITAVAYNHAGLKSTFKSRPVILDKTPPQISGIVASTVPCVNRSTLCYDIVAKWNVSDYESGIKYCLCGYGKLKDANDVQKQRLSASTESCVLPQLHFSHGETVFVKVKCINNVEMASEMFSREITISTEAPEIGHARSRYIAAENNDAFHTYSNMSAFIQTDRSRVKFEWSGFEDVSGIDHYEYRLVCHNDTVVGWRSSGKRTVVEINGLDLMSGNRYTAEVRAVNAGHHTSLPVISEMIVYDREPKLTGKSLTVKRSGQLLRLDWGEVFEVTDGLPVTYDVTVGSRKGFTDILQLECIEANTYDVTVPLTTIISPDVQEIFFTISCTYSTGLYTVYRSTYKL